MYYYLNDLYNVNNIDTSFVNNLSDINFKLNSLSIFSMNIRSISCHFDEFLVLLSTVKDKFDIIILSETWVNYNCELTINGYMGFHCSGSLNKADGLSMFVHKRFNVSDINYNLIENCSSIEANISFCDISFCITGVYRSPSYNVEHFLKSYDIYLNQIRNVKFHYTCGDFNINILSNDLICNDYLNMLAKYQYFSCINGITRSANSSNSNIDHIFVKNVFSNNISSYIIYTSISDHYSTAVVTDLSFFMDKNYKNNKDTKYNNNYVDKINFDILNNILKSENWDSLLSDLEVDDMCSVFQEKILFGINLASIKVKKKKKLY